MSSRSLRGILAGILITSFLSLVGPIPGEAAGFRDEPAAPSLWVRAWQWLAEQIAPAETVASALTEATTGQDRSDAGWIMDPDG